MATETYAGPVDYLVFAFGQGADVTAGLKEVLARVDAGHIDLLDLEVIGRDNRGFPLSLSLADVSPDADATLAEFEGAASGILDDGDLGGIAAALEDGQFAVAVVYEDRSLASAADAWALAGGVELFSGGVDIADLETHLEEGTLR